MRLVVLGTGEVDQSIGRVLNDIIVTTFLTTVSIVPLAFLLRGLATSTDALNARAEELAAAHALTEQQNQELAASNIALAESNTAFANTNTALARSNAALEQTEQQLRDLVATLETPTVVLAGGVLLAPIVGALDSRRAERLKARLLDDVHRQNARIVVIDLTGVPVVDGQVAQGILEIGRAIRLLGGQVVLTGISAAIAQTVVYERIDLTGIVTVRSPQEVLTTLLK
ncbi:MAG: STAS domain-containing protein [Chloroflexaceae bacterium]|nr:STAS domain-containing protein [Chloroflexaceae bacterium]